VIDPVSCSAQLGSSFIRASARVVFPEPDSPTMPTRSPAATEKLAPRTAVTLSSVLG